MTRPNGRKLACLPAEAPTPPAAPAASLKSSGVVTSRTVRRIKEMMAFDRETLREGEESVWPLLEGCLATMAEHDGEPTEEQARREDAFAYLLEVLRNQEEDAASEGDDEENSVREMSDMWS